SVYSAPHEVSVGARLALNDNALLIELTRLPDSSKVLAEIMKHPEETPTLESIALKLQRQDIGILPPDWWSRADQAQKLAFGRVLSHWFVGQISEKSPDWNAREVIMANGKRKILVPYIPVGTFF